jgi:hypothetical protein
VRVLLDEMRLIKDETEIVLMQRAASISATAHTRAMRSARPVSLNMNSKPNYCMSFFVKVRKHLLMAPSLPAV